MKIRYTWQPEEWREAMLLATARPRRRKTLPFPYLIVGIMSLGAVGDLVHVLRSTEPLRFTGSLAPVILLTAAVTSALLMLARAAERNKRVKRSPEMPVAEQELIVGEDGWTTAPLNRSEANSAEALSRLRSWNDLREQRTGRRTLVLVGAPGSFAAVPLRALSETQGGHLHRLLVRKLHVRP